MPRPNETTHHQILPLGSDPELRRRFMVLDEPLRGNLRFGLLLEVLDKIAEETALKYVNRYHPDARVVTAAIDDIFVRHAADVTRDIAFHARINHVGRSSLVVGIRVEQPGDPVNHIASCHFTMVARSGRGDQEASVALPPLEYLDEAEQRRAAKAVASRAEYQRQQALLSEPPSREEFEMRAGEDAQTDDIDVFLEGGLGDHLGSLADAGIDDLATAIAQGAGDDFRAAVVAIEAGLGDKDAYFLVTHSFDPL